MNRYTEKIEKLSNHVAQNPRDYQSSIALLILQSKQFDYERKQKNLAALKCIRAYKQEGESANGEQK